MAAEGVVAGVALVTAGVAVWQAVLARRQASSAEDQAWSALRSAQAAEEATAILREQRDEVREASKAAELSVTVRRDKGGASGELVIKNRGLAQARSVVMHLDKRTVSRLNMWGFNKMFPTTIDASEEQTIRYNTFAITQVRVQATVTWEDDTGEPRERPVALTT